MKNLPHAVVTLSRLLLLGILLFTQLSGCAVNPVSGERDFVLMTEKQEVSVDNQYHQEILKQYKVYDDPALQDYVNQIGQELAKNSHRKQLTFHFTVLDSPEVNAFALPGGYIYITRGIMAYLNSEAELAGVLGHEIGHVTARHSVRQQSASQVTGLLGGLLNAATGQDPGRGLFSQLGVALTRGYGRDHELQADNLGAQYLARIGYAPDNMINVISVLKNQELFEKERAKREGRKAQTYHGVFASHPRNDKRLSRAVNSANQYRSGQNRAIGRARYLNKIDGLLFGQNADDGIVRNNAFYHAKLNAKLLAPQGWRIENRPDKLLFIAPNQAALLQIELLPHPQKHSAKKVLLDHLKRRSLSESASLSANGMQGYTGVTVINNTPFGKRKVRYSVWLRDQYAWVFAATTKQPGDFKRFAPAFEQAVNSLDKLSKKDRQLAQPLRLKVIRTTADSRYKTLAADSSLGSYAESQLRLLNASYPAGRLAPNTLIKTVQ